MSQEEAEAEDDHTAESQSHYQPQIDQDDRLGSDHQQQQQFVDPNPAVEDDPSSDQGAVSLSDEPMPMVEGGGVARRLRKGNLKSGVFDALRKSRRVSFDPLALLLDASLEGELELVKKTALEVIVGIFLFVWRASHTITNNANRILYDRSLIRVRPMMRASRHSTTPYAQVIWKLFASSSNSVVTSTLRTVTDGKWKTRFFFFFFLFCFFFFRKAVQTIDGLSFSS